MLRALAQLGVIHQPDFSEEMAELIGMDTFNQLSRSQTSVQTLERFGGALVLANISRVMDIEPELVHAARHGRAGREILLRAAGVLEERLSP